MKVIKKSKEINLLFNSSKKFGFVPTMGSLHDGHKSLIKRSIKENDQTIVSIFINPKQFNNKQDLKNYPKDINKDLAICKKLGVNFVFLPTFAEVYNWKKTKNKFPKVENILENKFRRGHFKGVLLVIDKLFNIIKAKKVYLGKKDYQQIQVIKDYIKINKLNIKIIECKTIREKNGLAMSSRNSRLNNQDIMQAANIIKVLRNFKKKNMNMKIKKLQVSKILKDLNVKFDYVDVIKLKTFKKTNHINKDTNLFVAFYLSSVRLIDNF